MIRGLIRKIYNRLYTSSIILFIKIFGNKYEKILINKIPDGLLFRNIIHQRFFLINSKLKYSVHFTSRVSANMESLIIENESISVLKSLAVSGNCYIGVHKGTKLFIGRDTIWAPSICINTANHDLWDRNVSHQASINIGRNNWIAFGVVITKGVEIGDNVTVAANSVVNQNFGDNLVIGGLPAKILKEIPENT